MPDVKIDTESRGGWAGVLVIIAAAANIALPMLRDVLTSLPIFN